MWEELVQSWMSFRASLAEIPIPRMIAAILVICVTMVSRRLLNRFVLKRLQRLAARQSWEYTEHLIEAIRRPLLAFFFIFGFYTALRLVGLSEYSEFIHQAFRVSVAVVVIWLLYRLSDFLTFTFSKRWAGQDVLLERQFVPLLRKSLKTFVVLIGVLVVAQNLGYSITSVLTGLGIGGLAVALAAQETLANFFASIMLLTDMPFRVGDVVKFNSTEGSIEQIGFRSTRMRTASKSMVSVPNKIFMNAPIENFTQRDRRRINVNLGLTYDAGPEKVERYVNLLRGVLSSHPGLHAAEQLVFFNEMRESSLNVMVECYTLTTSWTEYLTIQQELQLTFMRIAAEEGIEFAFPSRTVYWGGGQAPAPVESREGGTVSDA